MSTKPGQLQPYRPIRSPADVAAHLVVGATREDHWLDFKGLDPKTGRAYPQNDAGKDECRLDVAQFSNASGGTLVVGAVEVEHVLSGFTSVPHPQEFLRWVDEVVKEKLEPVPAIESYVARAPSGEDLAIINVPPALRLVARRRGADAYEFPLRTADSRRFLRLSEIEARMQDRDRMNRLRLEQVGPENLN